MKACWISIVVAALATISAGQAPAAESLAKRSGCLECHSVDSPGIGPSLHAIAAKHKNEAGARKSLIEKVKKGSKGDWTQLDHGVPMPPYSGRLTDAEIKRLVEWLLSL